ncbi:cytochrome C [Sulfurirhabdus autotrophica]|nr:cytochrome C [Sulfurirhabdus autotrophica]
MSEVIETAPAPQTTISTPPPITPPSAPEQATPVPFTASRGQLLYELQCVSCHESMLHIRSNRRVTSLSELRRQVEHWSDVLKPTWSVEDIDDVTRYLNTRFYKLEIK